MALLTSNRVLCCLCLKNLGVRHINIIRNKCDKIVTLEIDTLDEFTNQLIQQKINKWNKKDMGQNKVNNIDNRPFKQCKYLFDLRLITGSRLNSLIQEKIEIDDISTIIDIANQCIELRKCPSISNVLYIFTICAQRGDKKTILGLIDICKDKLPTISKENSYFQHFLAQAIWVSGNIHESLNIFEEVYGDNPCLRRRIRLILKNLIYNVITSRSEAALVNLVKFCEKLSNSYHDTFPLVYIWQTCFLSEWFHDQELAIELLIKHTNLRQYSTTRLPFVVAISLKNHRTDIVYRLLEVLLKFEMKNCYSGVILALLNYQIHQRDLKGCVETVKWSLENDINLPAIHHEKFFDLVLNHDTKNVINEGKLRQQKSFVLTSEYKF